MKTSQTFLSSSPAIGKQKHKLRKTNTEKTNMPFHCVFIDADATWDQELW